MKNWYTMAWTMLSLLSASVLLGQQIDKVPIPLFEVVAKPTLSESQNKFLAKQKNANQPSSSVFIKINSKALIEQQGDLLLQIPGQKDFIVHPVSLTKKADGRMVWKGVSSPFKGNVTFFINQDKVTGGIFLEENIFSIQPLGEGLHELKPQEEDGNPCGNQHPLPAAYKKPTPPKSNNQDSEAQDNEMADLGECKIRLMVVYTNSVADRVSDIRSLIDARIDEFNMINENSEVDFEVELARSIEVDYTESDNKVPHPIVAGWSVSQDLLRLWDEDDGFMDNIHPSRALYDADMVILLVDNLPGYAGEALVINADAETAFCVMEWENNKFTFTHEFGHLIGMHHNSTNGTIHNDDFDYGHGYFWIGAGPNFRTVMSYDSPCGSASCPRIPHWSNPDVTYGSSDTPTGTANRHNNARVARVREAAVAGFEPQVLHKQYTRNDVIDDNESASLLAAQSISTNNFTVRFMSGSSGSFTAGETIVLRPGFWALRGSSFQTDLDRCGQNADLSSADQPLTNPLDQKVIRPALGANLALSAAPNPAGSQTTLEVKLKQAASVKLEVFNLTGQLIAVPQPVQPFEAGTHQIQLNTSRFAPGIYLVRLSANDLQQSVRLVVAQ